MALHVPPPYEARPHDDVEDDPVVDPTIFILAGQSIHSDTSDSAPVYELSRNVTGLTKATEKVVFERVDIIVSRAPADDGAGVVPTVKRRRRHLYDLRRTAKQPRIGFSRSRSSSDAPEYYIHSLSSRRTLGHVGLCKSPHGGFAAGFSALPVQVPAATNHARFAADGRGRPVFTLRHKGERLNWVKTAAAAAMTGGKDEEEIVAIEDAEDNQHRLILMEAMPRKAVDALVALWCCRIWQQAAERAATARQEGEPSSFMRKVAIGQSAYMERGH